MFLRYDRISSYVPSGWEVHFSSRNSTDDAEKILLFGWKKWKLKDERYWVGWVKKIFETSPYNYYCVDASAVHVRHTRAVTYNKLLRNSRKWPLNNFIRFDFFLGNKRKKVYCHCNVPRCFIERLIKITIFFVNSIFMVLPCH